MSKTLSIFIFHRDFRLEDNTTLIALAKEHTSPILPIFIFTPDQIDAQKNPYFSHPSVQFMCESLDDLGDQLKDLGRTLYCFKGDTLRIVQALVKTARNAQRTITAIGWNEDYSVYAVQRDKALREWCESNGIQCVVKEDYGLLPLRTGLLPDGRPYRVLSQFYKKILKMEPTGILRAPATWRWNESHFAQIPFALSKKDGLQIISSKDYHTLYTPLPQLAIHGGRHRGLEMLQRIRAGTYKDYTGQRDFPAKAMTTRASPHLKFGTVSIREMLQTIRQKEGLGHGLIRELVFRDFYMKIYALQPNLQRGVALLDALDKAIPWSYDKKLFHTWTTGTTGYPLVDAGMRELNTTGFQHNRVRMLTSSVLTKYFLIDWRWGLKYFYQHLVDADIFSNTAGWGFSSSTGADAVPYFRAPFNPFIQSQKFDRDAVYIRQWVPELASVAAADIHRWYDPAIRAKYPSLPYPAPVIDHKEASARAMKVFRTAAEKTKE